MIGTLTSAGECAHELVQDACIVVASQVVSLVRSGTMALHLRMLPVTLHQVADM
jgi:dTDP-4-amino-4,6-dideoxygalactose transaminase